MNKWLLFAGGIVLWLAYQSKMRESLPLVFTEIYPGDSESDTTAPGFIEQVIENFQPEISDVNKNRTAFLAMLRATEGTAQYEAPYAVIFGGVEMDGFDYSDHPANLGFTDWTHFNDQRTGKDNYSTASGAYQFTRATWNRLRTKLKLPDFSPASQDFAALELIREKGALDDIDDGDVIGAAKKVSTIWASLPGSPYGQPTKSAEFVASAFNNALTVT